jgi:hypothetical protein
MDHDSSKTACYIGMRDDEVFAPRQRNLAYIVVGRDPSAHPEK